MYDKNQNEMLKLVEKGYAEVVKVSDVQPKTGLWYLPHHGVVSDKKADKLRSVFDCASKAIGPSNGCKARERWSREECLSEDKILILCETYH